MFSLAAPAIPSQLLADASKGRTPEWDKRCDSANETRGSQNSIVNQSKQTKPANLWRTKMNPHCINCAIDIHDCGYVAIPSDYGTGAFCSEWCKAELEGE